MKRFSIIALLAVLAFSCKKSEDTPASTANFNITGIRDVDLTTASDGTYTYQISVVPVSGAKDTVTLFGDLFPTGVYATFQPRTGVTPFTSLVTISTDYSTGAGGTYALKLKGAGHSGTRAYDFNVTLPPFRGWQLGSAIYEKLSLQKVAPSGSNYAGIKVTSAGGAELRLSFAAGVSLPSANSTFSIGGTDTGKKNIRIALYDGAHIWSATGKRTDGSSEPATGTFTFDTLRKFTFKCSNVEMSDGINSLPLNCSFSE
jgi:hypothetical protein